MAKTFITFGQTHVHSVNGKTFDKDCVAVIECDSWLDGREKAFEFFGPTWCMEYHEKEWGVAELEWYPRGFINVNF